MNQGPIRSTLTIAALLLAGCAKIAAPDVDYAGPTPSVDVRASGARALFSHFKDGLAISAISLQHAGPVPPVTTAVAAGTSDAGVSSVRLTAIPTFSAGDTVTVTWSGTVVNLLGASRPVTQQARYRIVAASLVVQTPAAALQPGQSGKVCVALLPNAPADVTVRLGSSAVAITPAVLHIAAGQSRAAAPASATMGAFTCPVAGASPSAAVLPPLPCSDSTGVTASATLGGMAIHGCGVTPRCCAGGGQGCGSGAAAAVSACP